MSSSTLLLQVLIILVTARMLGLILRYFGQTSVIGEMAAGIVLGPMVFGALAPELHAEVFSPSSLGGLRGLSELGVVLFMFIVGAGLRQPMELRKHIVAASWIGALSVFVPMVLGIGLAALVYDRLAPPGVAFWPFALFLASALSITALPVMARILQDRQMTRTVIGRLSLTGAAVADLIAWVMLGLGLMLAGSEPGWMQFALSLGGLVAAGAVTFLFLKPLLSWLLVRYASDGRPGGAQLAILLIGTFACALGTDLLGVHAVFGAFLFGACLPRDDRLLATLIERIEHVTILVLMPIFFALAGLNTTPDAFHSERLDLLILILALAMLGKLAGGAIGAIIGGQPWRSSMAIGALMNARGLTELIVIQIGLDLGIIGGDLFTMLMIMAIVTTAMTGPLLAAFVGIRAAAPQGQPAAPCKSGHGAVSASALIDEAPQMKRGFQARRPDGQTPRLPPAAGS